MAQQFNTVEEYIASFPDKVQGILEEIWRRCHAAVPESGEMISYGIPTITLDGKYVAYFAGWAHHISVYPVPAGGTARRRAPQAPGAVGHGRRRALADRARRTYRRGNPAPRT